MAHCNTILAQILKLVPRHEFETLAKQHHTGRAFRSASRWSQFVVLMVGQLSGRCSLRDMLDSLSAQRHRLYHAGSRWLPRSTLARLNEDKPYALYEALFGKLLARCQALTPRHGFRFKHPLYSLDASTIDLCLSIYPWANFRSTKGAVKLHVGLNHNGYLPEFVTITDGKTQDVTAGRTLRFPKGSIVVMDRGYNDYAWFNQLTKKGIVFVTRLKANARTRIVERRQVPGNSGVSSDHIIEFTGYQAAKNCPTRLRRVTYRDPETGIRYRFLTNHFKLAARTIADIYKSRWQVELFFKWIKQNLKIKSFVGTSKNAVMTQIWIALCAYLMIAYLKFISKTTRSMQQTLRILQLNLFEKRDLYDLLCLGPPRAGKNEHPQLALI